MVHRAMHRVLTIPEGLMCVRVCVFIDGEFAALPEMTMQFFSSPFYGIFSKNLQFFKFNKLILFPHHHTPLRRADSPAVDDDIYLTV